MRQRKSNKKRTKKRRVHSTTRNSMGRGAKMCRDADNCDHPPVSRINTTKQQLMTTESSISRLDNAIRAIEEKLSTRKSQSLTNRASARSKRNPGAGKEGNKSALYDLKRAKMADRDVAQLTSQQNNLKAQRSALLKTAKRLRSEIVFDRAQRDADSHLNAAHAAANSALREAIDLDIELPETPSTVSSVDSEEAERRMIAFDRPPTPLTPGEQALLDEIEFDNVGKGVRHIKRKGKSRRKYRKKKRTTRKKR